MGAFRPKATRRVSTHSRPLGTGSIGIHALSIGVRERRWGRLARRSVAIRRFGWRHTRPRLRCDRQPHSKGRARQLDLLQVFGGGGAGEGGLQVPAGEGRGGTFLRGQGKWSGIWGMYNIYMWYAIKDAGARPDFCSLQGGRGLPLGLGARVLRSTPLPVFTLLSKNRPHLHRGARGATSTS